MAIEPQEMTAEQIRDRLAAGDEVWLWEGDRPKHKVYSVEDLTADHVTLGEDFKIFFKGAITGRTLGKHMSRKATIKAVTRRPSAGLPQEEKNGQAQHP